MVALDVCSERLLVRLRLRPVPVTIFYGLLGVKVDAFVGVSRLLDVCGSHLGKLGKLGVFGGSLYYQYLSTGP